MVCGPIADGYESRTIPNDLKEDHDNRRNQQVYSASPVKTVDKTNDSGKTRVSILCIYRIIHFNIYCIVCLFRSFGTETDTNSIDSILYMAHK